MPQPKQPVRLAEAANNAMKNMTFDFCKKHIKLCDCYSAYNFCDTVELVKGYVQTLPRKYCQTLFEEIRPVDYLGETPINHVGGIICRQEFILNNDNELDDNERHLVLYVFLPEKFTDGDIVCRIRRDLKFLYICGDHISTFTSAGDHLLPIINHQISALKLMPNLEYLTVSPLDERGIVVLLIGKYCLKLRKLKIDSRSNTTYHTRAVSCTYDATVGLCYMFEDDPNTNEITMEYLRDQLMKKQFNDTSKTTPLCLTIEALLGSWFYNMPHENREIILPYFTNLRNFHGRFQEVYKNLSWTLESMQLYITSNEVIENLVAVYPNIKKLVLLYACDDYSTDNLHLLSNLVFLHDIKIICCEAIHESSFFEFLRVHGPKLTSLDLMLKTHTVDISKISTYCPNLIELKIITGFITCTKQVCPMNKLKKFQISVRSNSPNGRDEIGLFAIFKSISSSVQSMSISDLTTLNDERIHNVFHCIKFPKLEIFKLYNAPRTTLLSIHYLIRFCPQLTDVIGAGAFNYSSGHLSLFVLHEIKKVNWDLSVTVGGRHFNRNTTAYTMFGKDVGQPFSGPPQALFQLEHGLRQARFDTPHRE